MQGYLRGLLGACLLYLFALAALVPSGPAAAQLPREDLAELVVPPFSLGEPLGENGVYELLSSGGAHAGYVFETEPMAPLPGFAGAPINVLVTLDLEGRFLDIRLLEHNEPIFVSGLGEAPFRAFFEQYRGHSISSSLVVGVPYGEAASASSLVYLDGVSKATASVRIAHETILAATLAVARERMQGIARPPAAFPDPDYNEKLTWADLVREGLAARFQVTNAEVQKAFDGTLWERDDPEALADPSGSYLDLWIVDLGPDAIAQATLAPDSLAELRNFLAISPHDEPILVIESGRHGLVSEDFVRNTSPDWLAAEQDGLPVALRDADLLVELQDDVPEGVALILRADRRLGFDPTRDWTMTVLSVREHGSLLPEIGTATLSTVHRSDERFFVRAESIKPSAPWVEALRNRAGDLAALALFLTALIGVLAARPNALAALERFTPVRLAILGFMIVFVGWWGQGQLSIVTVLGVQRTVFEGGSFTFLLYDPFSLLIWVVAIAGFVLWGRGLFCGWLCPFGALQEFAHHAGRRLGLRQIRVSQTWDGRLKWVKYILLGGLVLSVFIVPGQIDALAEIEPFKTAVTVYFVREWYYVLYAVSWLVLGMFVFKGFCRYVCPLGAVMAIGGFLRQRDWITRRDACGSPCQLCKVRCHYNAIAPNGSVQYSECFQCLDCVKIHDDSTRCVPLILAGRRRKAA